MLVALADVEEESVTNETYKNRNFLYILNERSSISVLPVLTYGAETLTIRWLLWLNCTNWTANCFTIYRIRQI